MAARRSATLLLLPAALLIGVLIWVLAPSDDSAKDPGAAQVRPMPSVFEPGGARPVEIVLAEPKVRAGAVSTDPSTVLWPLEVELELLAPADLPKPLSGPAFGTGRSAVLTGQVGDERGQPAQASVRFVAGPNVGRELRTDAQGRYGASDLLPGMNVVEVSGPGLLGARREIRTSLTQDSELNLGFGRPGSVSGRLYDDQGQLLVGATVVIDGHPCVSNEDGIFYLDRCAPGRVLVEIDHPGFAPFRQVLGVTQNYALPHQRLTYRLERAASLTVVLDNLIGPSGDTRLFVLPAAPDSDRRFDWSRGAEHRISGEELTLNDLPPGPVRIFCYRSGALASPRMQNVNLISGENVSVRVRFEAAPTLRGHVLSEGKLVRGASVRILAADPPAAQLRHTAFDSLFLESEVFPILPAIDQQLITDDRGEFLATAWSEVSPWRLVEALSPDGTQRALAAVGPADTEIELELKPLTAGGGEFELDLPGRLQPLPVEIRLNGQPQAAFELPSDQPLRLTGLKEGVWRLRVRWYDQQLFKEQDLEIQGRIQRKLELPEAAILGQDQATWARSGRPWPL